MRSTVFKGLPRAISLLVLIALLGVPVARGQAPSSPIPTPAAESAATIVITASVPGALVFVDHTLIGKAPLNASVAPGRHEIRVSAGEEYVPFVQEVTVAGGGSASVHAALSLTAPALYQQALASWRAGRSEEAGRLFERASQATGKRAPDIPFYLGMLAERSGDMRAAERWFLAWLNVEAGSASGQYHLGKVRQALHKDALSATAYKNALLAAVSDAAGLLAEAGSPTASRIAHLRATARSPGAAALPARLQEAYLLELKGSIVEARDAYRGVFESIMRAHHVDLDDPAPAGLPLQLPPPSPPGPPAAPANTMYVTGDSMAGLSAAWHACARTHPTMHGPVLIGPARHHWIPIQARAFDSASQDEINAMCEALSGSLRTDVLFLQITKDGRAWYFYWNSGQKLDQYCSNPGHPGEVDYRTLRAWSGKPEVMARLCRGTPLSSKSAAPSMTDLNAILYFYYPELRVTRPAAWRTAETFMKLLARVLGLADLPSRYANRSGSFHPL
jgi:tetratricopeptide (TPR) repeat protein